MNSRRLFLYLLIASVGLSAIVGIGVLLFGNFGELEVRVLFTTLTVTVTSIFGLACGASLESGRGKYLPLAGIAFSILSAVMCFLIIWDLLDDNWEFIKSFLTATMLAAACSHLSLLSLARLDRRFAWTRTAAHICVWLLTAILLYILWAEPESSDGLVTRILGVLAILVATITVVTPVLHKLSNNERTVEQIRDEIEELEARIYHLNQERLRLQSLEDEQ